MYGAMIHEAFITQSVMPELVVLGHRHVTPDIIVEMK